VLSTMVPPLCDTGDPVDRAYRPLLGGVGATGSPLVAGRQGPAPGARGSGSGSGSGTSGGTRRASHRALHPDSDGGGLAVASRCLGPGPL